MKKALLSFVLAALVVMGGSSCSSTTPRRSTPEILKTVEGTIEPGHCLHSLRLDLNSSNTYSCLVPIQIPTDGLTIVDFEWDLSARTIAQQGNTQDALPSLDLIPQVKSSLLEMEGEFFVVFSLQAERSLQGKSYIEIFKYFKPGLDRLIGDGHVRYQLGKYEG